MKKRFFKAIYFPYTDETGTKHSKIVSVAFNPEKEKHLIEKVRKLSSTDIKRIIGVYSYSHLINIAEMEDRRVTEIIKIRLRQNGAKKGKHIQRTVRISVYKLEKWLKSLKKAGEMHFDNSIQEITSFFEGLKYLNK